MMRSRASATRTPPPSWSRGCAGRTARPVPRCGSADHSYLATRRLWKCRACARQYSVKAGTLFEGSPLGLDRWLPAIWAVANDEQVSSHELARRLGITQKSAWLMLRRIRLAMPPD